MSNIFICYRRADSQSATGRIYDHLVQAFGKNAVFIDVDNIPAGVDFRSAIDATIQRSAVMLVIIGPGWLTAADANGRRLDQINDRVRIEVESGLLRRMPVIPVLVDGARMPEARELPPTLSQLAYQNGREVQPNPHFQMDINRLIDSIAQVGVPRITAGEVVNPPRVYQFLEVERTPTDVRRNDTSMASLLWGIAAYVMSFLGPIGIMLGIPAIRNGRKALQIARETPLAQANTRGSRIMAMIGISLGYVGIGCGAIMTIILLVIGIAVLIAGGLYFLPGH
jgi:TIR domain